MFSPASLVNVFPREFFKKFATIKIIPLETSDIATKLAINGESPKYSVSPSGGKGNFPRPQRINAIPTPNLRKSDAKASKFEKKLLNFRKK